MPFGFSSSRCPSLKELQGEWKVVRIGKNGNRAPFFIMWLAKLRFRLEGDRYTVVASGQPMEEGTFTLSPQDGYAWFDQVIGTGPNRGKTHLGILRLLGTKLEHLQSEIGDPRPLGFPYGKSTVANMALMKRA